ncbi:MAG: hypothetical protein Q8M24_09685, partial [Pseudolabrys sp.]|nr:hypothetical protein [Pseudolabrys sp.]
MNSAKSLLLACTAMGAALAVTPALAATPDMPFAAARKAPQDTASMIAQAPLTPAQIEAQKKAAEEEAKKKAAPPPPPAARPAPPPPPAARPAPPP